jgi:hypothetical protein
MSALPDIKARVVSQLPASITSGLGVAVQKTNGVWNFALNYSNIQVKDAIPSAEFPVTQQLYWNSSTSAFTLVPYAVSSPKVTGTSETSASLTLGAKSFVVETGIGWTSGLRLRGINQSDTSQYVEGLITSYDSDSGALAIDVDNVSGTGTVTSWFFGVAGDIGKAPPTSFFDTVAEAEASALITAPDSIQTRAKAAIGDHGGAIYKKNGTTSGDLVITLSDGTTVVGYTQVEAVLRPSLFGAAGDGTTDDTTALQAMNTAAVAGQTLDYGNATYLISGQIKANDGVTHRGSGAKIKWTTSSPLNGALVVGNTNWVDGIEFIGSGSVGNSSGPLYQVAIHSGATSTAGRSPSSFVTVRGCKFSNMTVGVWINPDSNDTTPTDWHIADNTFFNIVGYRGSVTGGGVGQSEGYGVIFGLASRVNVIGNNFNTIARHAIYATATNGFTIANNIIDAVDNDAIQLNTFSAQPSNFSSTITGNVVKGLTRSVVYGYRSSVGIGIYGRTVGINVSGNMIFGALDIGIDLVGISGDTVQTGARALIASNHIVMDSTATFAGVHVSNFFRAAIIGNKIELQGAITGIDIDNSQAITGPIVASGNFISTSNSGATALVTALSGAQTVLAHNNLTDGFTPGNRWSDSSSAGIVRTDFNAGTQSITSDGDYTHLAGAHAPECAGFVKFTGSLSANRNFNLDTTFIPPWIKSIRLFNASSTNFSFAVKNGSGGTTLKSVAQNTWADFAVTQTPDWAYVGSGTV